MNLQATNMIIHAESRVNDIERDFTVHFPYLRLKFLNTGAEKKVNTINTYTVKTPPAFEMNNSGEPKKIIIYETMTVSELETAFYNLFGVQIEVLRKSGNVWLETNYTNNWTLQQQNKMGEQIS
jgi:hypothetical protein